MKFLFQDSFGERKKKAAEKTTDVELKEGAGYKAVSAAEIQSL
jgi:hypothetical protein